MTGAISSVAPRRCVKLAGPGGVSLPEAAALNDTGSKGMMSGHRVRSLRSSCPAGEKAAVMPMIPQLGAEESFDGALDAIDAAIDAELEAEHDAAPARHKKKVCCGPCHRLCHLTPAEGLPSTDVGMNRKCTLRMSTS